MRGKRVADDDDGRTDERTDGRTVERIMDAGRPNRGRNDDDDDADVDVDDYDDDDDDDDDDCCKFVDQEAFLDKNVVKCLSRNVVSQKK